MKNFKNIKNNKLERLRELVRLFLLYNFLKLPQGKKEKFFNKQVPEVILRTMKLEGEKINRKDVQKLLKLR